MKTLKAGTVQCCGCGNPCVRKSHEGKKELADLPRIFSRTMFRGHFEPSCSEACWLRIQRLAGLMPPAEANGKYAMEVT